MNWPLGCFLKSKCDLSNKIKCDQIYKKIVTTWVTPKGGAKKEFLFIKVDSDA
jgi:hypothetical protein